MLSFEIGKPKKSNNGYEKERASHLRDVHYNLLKCKSSSPSLHKKETIHPLFMAIFQNDYSLFTAELAILSAEDINSLTYAGNYPLHATCSVSNMEMMMLLLEKGANVSTANILGNSALHIAVTQAWTEGVKELLRYGANPDAFPEENAKVKGVLKQTPFHIAVKAGNIPLVSLIFYYKPNLTLKDGECNSILHMAAYSKCAPLLKILLKEELCQIYLRTGNENGDLPLHSLMNNENISETDNEVLKCAEILIKEGADLNFANTLGETPLYLACCANFHQVVEYLLKQGADPTILTKMEKSVLHASCQSGSSNSLKHILTTGRVSNLILKEDYEGQSPFHKAVNSYSIDCCELLLNNGDHLTHKDSHGDTRCSLILQNLPHAIELLTRIFDASTKVSTSKLIHDPAFRVIFDYSIILSTEPCGSQSCLIREITSPRFESLLKHPLIESFLYIKWGRIKPFFYLGLVNFSLFLLVHTAFVIQTYGGQKVINWTSEENLGYFNAFKSLYFIFGFLIIIPDFIIIFTNAKKYLMQYETYAKLIFLLTSFFLLFCTSQQDYDINFLRNLAAVSVFCGWLELMLFLGRFPTYGVYILMFLRVSKSIIKFLIAFSFLLIGYACSFSILFYDVGLFKNLPLTILKTLMMMVGEIEYGDIYRESNLTLLFETRGATFHSYINDVLRFFLLTSFLFLIPVLMANLLIGLAVNDIPDLRRQGKIRRLAKQASYIVAYERLMLSLKELFCFPVYLRKALVSHYAICGEVSLHPNKNVQNPRRHLRVPSETLREAIVIGAKIEETSAREDICQIKVDMETQFKKFLKQYSKDQKLLESRLTKMTNKNSSDNEMNTLLLSIENMQREIEKQHKLLSKLCEIKGDLVNNS